MRVGQEACLRCRLFQDFHLATDARLLGHLFGKVGIALFQVVSHFVRLDLFLVEITPRGLCQVGKARMFLRRSMLVDVAGQKPRRLRLPACQPSPGFECDCWLSTGAWAVVERSHWPFGHGALHAALDGLMMQSERLTYRKKRGVFRARFNCDNRSGLLAMVAGTRCIPLCMGPNANQIGGGIAEEASEFGNAYVVSCGFKLDEWIVAAERNARAFQ